MPDSRIKYVEKIESDLHGDMQSMAEMTMPILNRMSNTISEIPCRVNNVSGREHSPECCGDMALVRRLITVDIL